VIDTNKNAYYLICSYWTSGKGNKGEVKFLSRHSINSKIFKEFKSNYFKNILKIGEKRMNEGYYGTTDTQRTITIDEWKHSKDKLLKDITDEQICG